MIWILVNSVVQCVASSCHRNYIYLHLGTMRKSGHLCKCESRIFQPVAFFQPDLEHNLRLVYVGHEQGRLQAPRHVDAHQVRQRLHVVKHLTSLELNTLCWPKSHITQRFLAWQGVDYPFCSLWFFQSSFWDHAAVVRAVKASSLAVVRSTLKTLAAVVICVTVALSQTTNLILRTARVSSSAALDSWHGDVGGGDIILTCTIVHLRDFLVKVAVGHSQIAMAKVC